MDNNIPIDEMIEESWNLCQEWWSFSAASDQWWYFRATCPHAPEREGKLSGWTADSRGSVDLSTAIISVYEQAAAVQHPEEP